MGICASDIQLIEKAFDFNPLIRLNVCELGSQNLYLDNNPKPPFASDWYKRTDSEGLSNHHPKIKHIDYRCIDLAGDNGAYKLNLAFQLASLHKRFDLVTDFGTSEHVVLIPEYQSVAFHEGHINSVYPKEQPTEQQIREGFYNCWYNKDYILNVGGLMINVNPKTGNWPGHGYTYLTKDFYFKLAELMEYEILHMEDHAAMGNTFNGWNVCCILRKKLDRPFISFEEFQQCEQLRS